MNFSIYFLLIICLSIIIGESSPFPKEKDLERIAGGNESITGSRDGTILKLSKGGEIFRKDHYVTFKNVLVWKGTFNQTIDVAIKIFNKKEEFRREMNIFEALKATKEFDIKKHRIPRVYYHGPILRGYFAIAMTLFEETLGRRRERKRKKFSESTVLLIFKQVVESLNYIHSKNVAHYDIHPGNIFILGKDVFIGDFDSSVVGGNLMRDYEAFLIHMWKMAGVPYNYDGSNDEKLKYFQNEIIRDAFRSILDTENINGIFGIVPDYKKIIKISNDALEEIGKTSGPVQFEWLKGGNRASGGCFFFSSKQRK